MITKFTVGISMRLEQVITDYQVYFGISMRFEYLMIIK